MMTRRGHVLSSVRMPHFLVYFEVYLRVALKLRVHVPRVEMTAMATGILLGWLARSLT